MLIYPAIDLKDGVCVRLMHGKFDQVTRYDEQPAARLTAFAAEGAEWIHIVDLDGAEAGEARQHALIGDRVILHPGVQIGQDGFGYASGPTGILKMVQVGRVVIQDNVEIGANTTVDRGALRDTVIGETPATLATSISVGVVPARELLQRLAINAISAGVRLAQRTGTGSFLHGHHTTS